MARFSNFNMVAWLMPLLPMVRMLRTKRLLDPAEGCPEGIGTRWVETGVDRDRGTDGDEKRAETRGGVRSGGASLGGLTIA